MKANTKKYTIRLLLGFSVYTALVLSAHWFLDLTENEILRHAIALAPVLPTIFVGWVMLVFVRSTDEVQRLVLTESYVVSFILVGFGTFSYGFLEAYLGYPHLPTIWVLPALIGTQGLASAVVRRRYL